MICGGSLVTYVSRRFICFASHHILSELSQWFEPESGLDNSGGEKVR